MYVQIKKIATMHYNDLLALTAAEARDETFLHEQTADHVLRLKIAWLALYHRFGDKCRYEYDGKKDHGGGGGTGDGARRQKMFTPNGNETDAARVQQAQDGKCRNDLDGHGRRNRRGALAAGTRRPASAATTSTVTAAATDAARYKNLIEPSTGMVSAAGPTRSVLPSSTAPSKDQTTAPGTATPSMPSISRHIDKAPSTSKPSRSKAVVANGPTRHVVQSTSKLSRRKAVVANGPTRHVVPSTSKLSRSKAVVANGQTCHVVPNNS